MGQYDPLREHLSSRATAEVPMTFSEIETVIGRSLPASARKHRAWWSNNPSNSVITHAWLDAGYQTERVDMASRRLVFRRAGPRHVEPRKSSARVTTPRDGKALFDELYGCMAGSVTVAPGVDLTDPTGEIWDAER
jgi:hypothetical protein